MARYPTYSHTITPYAVEARMTQVSGRAELSWGEPNKRFAASVRARLAPGRARARHELEEELAQAIAGMS